MIEILGNVFWEIVIIFAILIMFACIMGAMRLIIWMIKNWNEKWSD